jgi:hypothetical protein
MESEPHLPDATFSAQQAGVRRGAGLAAIFILSVLVATWHFGVRWPIVPNDTADRLAFVFRCEIAIGFVLWAMIARIAAMRYFSPDDIDGVGDRSAGVRIVQARAILQNTVEQSLLALIAHAGLALALPPERMAVIIAVVGFFVVGRISFWFGYPKGAAARAFGFGLTFYPTILALFATLVLSLL